MKLIEISKGIGPAFWILVRLSVSSPMRTEKIVVVNRSKTVVMSGALNLKN